MLLIDGVKFESYPPKDEQELANMAKEHSRQIFGEDSVYFDLKQKLTSKAGIASIPDGYVIKLSKPYEWYIVEIELSAHPVYDHIVTQLTKFIGGIENYLNQKEIVDAIFRQIEEDKVLRAQIEKMTGLREIHHFISELISNSPKIIAIIDKVDDRVSEACKALKHDVKITEFQTFVRDNAPSVHAHLFTPLISLVKPEVPTLPLAPRHRLRLEFWKGLLDENKKRMTGLFENVRPGKECWIGVGAGKSGLWFNYVILRHSSRVELYIDAANKDANKKIFNQLLSQKEQIEADFGGKIEWQRLNEKRASRIRVIVTNQIGLMDGDKWNKIQNDMIDAMIKFVKSLGERIRSLG